MPKDKPTLSEKLFGVRPKYSSDELIPYSQLTPRDRQKVRRQERSPVGRINTLEDQLTTLLVAHNALARSVLQNREVLDRLTNNLRILGNQVTRLQLSLTNVNASIKKLERSAKSTSLLSRAR